MTTEQTTRFLSQGTSTGRALFLFASTAPYEAARFGTVDAVSLHLDCLWIAALITDDPIGPPVALLTGQPDYRLMCACHEQCASYVFMSEEDVWHSTDARAG